jgi:hypothetical protein
MDFLGQPAKRITVSVSLGILQTEELVFGLQGIEHGRYQAFSSQWISSEVNDQCSSHWSYCFSRPSRDCSEARA